LSVSKTRDEASLVVDLEAHTCAGTEVMTMGWEIRPTNTGSLSLEVSTARANIHLTSREATKLGKALVAAAERETKRLEAERERARERWYDEHSIGD
jgi:hypothetical protein